MARSDRHVADSADSAPAFVPPWAASLAVVPVLVGTLLAGLMTIVAGAALAWLAGEC
jgi:hypothetical protein